MSTGGVLDRAQALTDLGRYRDAAALLGTLLGSEPHNAAALCLLAYCRSEEGDVPAMLAAAESACAADPQDEWALRLHSLALSRLQRPADAISAAQAALRAAPESWEAHIVLAAVLFALPWRRPVAMAAARRAVELAPQESQAHTARGALQHTLGLLGAARRSYRRALALDPQNVVAAENLGRIAESRGQLAGALGLYAAATATAPGRVDGAAHIRRVLVRTAAWAWMTGIGLMMVLLFAVWPPVWGLAAAMLGGYAWWAMRIVRAYPPALRPIVAGWARTDPQFVVRAIAAAIVFVAAVGIGVFSSVFGSSGGPLAMALIAVILAVLLTTAVAVIVVDRRAAGRGADFLVDLAGPEETTGWGKYVLFRQLRVSCLLGFVLWAVAITGPEDWLVRAVSGLLALVVFGFYFRWLAGRPARQIGHLWDRFAMPVPLVALATVANLLFAVAMIVLPESARSLLGNLAVVPFVLILFVVPSQLIWLLVRAVATLRR